MLQEETKLADALHQIADQFSEQQETIRNLELILKKRNTEIDVIQRQLTYWKKLVVKYKETLFEKYYSKHKCTTKNCSNQRWYQK